MKAWDWIKKVNKINLADSFFPGYVLNKWVFRIGIAIIFLWLLLAGASFGFKLENSVYVHCTVSHHYCEGLPFACAESCENPFYDPLGRNPVCSEYGICDREFLFDGETYGSPPSFLVTHAKDFAGLMVLLMLLLNHLLFNKGAFKKLVKAIKEEDLR